ncbi:MAG: hypothetical protein ACRCWI_06545 [Brevinema sp.]
MHITIFSVLILLVSYTYTQELDGSLIDSVPIIRSRTATRVVRDTTFQPYSTKNKVSSDVAEWRDRYQIAQEQYKVSLVGVNINSWLENPEYFNTLIDQAKKFPIATLLDNLQSYNPNLLFNDPSLVSSILNKDIYTPYLEVISNYQEKTIRFTDFKTVISYTRRYHIYGASAGDLPYFGRPIEGGKREINLSTLNGQITEIATKLPDTDIFLVAMINVIPNWLEEGWDIFQVNQQELEILVYAFDRRGKLIGGAGVPMNFLFEGKHFRIEQKIYSKIWQQGISRSFYAWPSFQIVNSKDQTKAVAIPQISVPPNKLPSLNTEQKYILETIAYLRENNESLDKEFFSTEGRKVFDGKATKDKRKIVLANRILQHKSSKLLVLEEPLKQLSLLAHLSDIAEEQVFSKREYQPSNEGDKLLSLLTYGVESLRTSPFSHTNVLHYTNNIAPYELEQDPISYIREQKKYAVIPYNIKEYRKNFVQDTKKLRKQKKIELQERLFWNDFRNSLLETTEDIEQNLYKDIKRAYAQWRAVYQDYMAISIKKLQVEREEELYVQMGDNLLLLLGRNLDFINDKYYKNPNKITNKIESIEKRVLKLEETFQQQKNNEKRKENLALIKEQFERLALEEKEKYKEFTSLIPNTFDCTVNYSDLTMTDQRMRARANNVENKLIALGVAMGKLSPLDRVAKQNIRKEQKIQMRNTRSFRYEGFMLGLTRAWTTKTRLADRLEQF